MPTSIDPEVLKSYGKPTFMDRSRALTGGKTPPMPDSEIGQEGPITYLFIAKMLQEFARNRQLDEMTGYTKGERKGFLDKGELPGEFTQKSFDPELRAFGRPANVETGAPEVLSIADKIRFLKATGGRISPRDQVVQDYDIQEF